MNDTILFEEKQHIGFNRITLTRNLVLVLFCFIAYYWTENREINGDVFFYPGCAILLFHILSLFITHIRIWVTPEMILLKGVGVARNVVIPVHKIRSAGKVKYSPYVINNPVFNLHRQGVIKFYSTGTEAIRIETDDNITYLIGTQKADELLRLLNHQLKEHHRQTSDRQ
jgi:hypothetical protein